MYGVDMSSSFSLGFGWSSTTEGGSLSPVFESFVLTSWSASLTILLGYPLIVVKTCFKCFISLSRLSFVEQIRKSSYFPWTARKRIPINVDTAIRFLSKDPSIKRTISFTRNQDSKNEIFPSFSSSYVKFISLWKRLRAFCTASISPSLMNVNVSSTYLHHDDILVANSGIVFSSRYTMKMFANTGPNLSLIHIWRCRRSYACRSRWSPYH